MRTPVVAPFRPVKPLDDEDDRINVIGDRGEPAVVLVRVIGRWSQQLDDAAQRSLRAEQGSSFMRRIIRLSRRVRRPAPGIVLLEYLIDDFEIGFQIGDEDRSVDHAVAQTFADFALAAAADGAWLVAERS